MIFEVYFLFLVRKKQQQSSPGSGLDKEQTWPEPMLCLGKLSSFHEETSRFVQLPVPLATKLSFEGLFHYDRYRCPGLFRNKS